MRRLGIGRLRLGVRFGQHEKMLRRDSEVPKERNPLFFA